MSAAPMKAPREPSPRAASLSSLALKHVLLVDDEAHVLRVMRISLERNGYEVDTALDGEIALRMLGERNYSAMIVAAGFAPGGRGLCESARRKLGAATPLMLVMDEESVPPEHWNEGVPDGVERIERPISLRWIAARLNEYFGAYGPN